MQPNPALKDARASQRVSRACCQSVHGHVENVRNRWET